MTSGLLVLAGLFAGVAICRTTADEPVWAFLFVASFMSAILGCFPPHG